MMKKPLIYLVATAAAGLGVINMAWAGAAAPRVSVVPALDSWGLVALGAVVGIAGLFALKRRK